MKKLSVLMIVIILSSLILNLYPIRYAYADTTFIDSTEATSGGSEVSSLAVSVPTHIDGDLLIAVIGFSEDEDADLDTHVDWTLDITLSVGQSPPSIPLVGIFYRTASSEPASYTFTISGSTAGMVGQIFSYREVNTSGDPFDGDPQTSQSVSIGCPLAPSINTSNDNTMVLYFGFMDDNEVPSPESNFYPSGTNGREATETTAGGNGMGLGTADELVISAGASGSAQFQNCVSSEEWGAITVALLPLDEENAQPTIADPEIFKLNATDRTYLDLDFDGRDKVFQDMQTRINITVTDADGRNNITQVHLNFNQTVFMMSFYNDSGSFIFNTTTPLIVENLEGIVDSTITDGYNITFVFSLSDQLDNGYYWLTNANVTDNNTNSTLIRERWFAFIAKPGVIGVVSTGTSELFPLAPLMNIFFIIGGFLLVFNAKGRLEFQASGMFFFLASLLFIISPIYAVLDSNNVLSYEILNYPDSIRNNFVLINFVFIGLGLTSVIINNKGRLGFRN